MIPGAFKGSRKRVEFSLDVFSNVFLDFHHLVTDEPDLSKSDWNVASIHVLPWRCIYDLDDCTESSLIASFIVLL